MFLLLGIRLPAVPDSNKQLSRAKRPELKYLEAWMNPVE